MKSVLITGASSGIGWSSALRMDSLGWRVFAGVRQEHDAVALQRVASERLVPVLLDVTVPEHVETAVELVTAEAGQAGLDGLVNNAGITRLCPLEAMSVEDFRRLLEVNTIGPAAVTQALLPQLRAAQGRVVFVSSISALRTAPLLSGYGASKAGLEAVADALRLELRRQGIFVSIIEPGAVRTPIWERGEAEIEAAQERAAVELDGLYERAIVGFRRLIDQGRSRRIDPEKVAGKIDLALRARRPRVRYLVGADARGQALGRHIPERAVDFVVARMLRL